jgi:hypothetical protein
MQTIKLFSNFLLAIIFCAFFTSCNNKHNNTQKSETSITENKYVPQEEFPDFLTAPNISVDLGKLIYDSNSGLPKASNKKNVLKELAKLVKQEPNCKQISIKYNMYFSSGNYSEDIEVIYDRTKNRVSEITIKSNIKDVYDNVTDDVISAAAKDKECLTLYCLTKYSKTDMTTDFSNRTIDAIGPKPKQSDIEGSVEVVVSYNKDLGLGNIKYLEWSKVTSIGKDWIVRAKIKTTKNGVEIIDNSWYYIQNNKVIKTKKIE